MDFDLGCNFQYDANLLTYRRPNINDDDVDMSQSRMNNIQTVSHPVLVGDEAKDDKLKSKFKMDDGHKQGYANRTQIVKKDSTIANNSLYDRVFDHRKILNEANM